MTILAALFCSFKTRSLQTLAGRAFHLQYKMITSLVNLYQLIYYDCQLSKARRSFGDDVLDLKLRCCHGQLSLFSMVTISSPAISRALLPMTLKADKLPLETKPDARDNKHKLNVKTR